VGDESPFAAYALDVLSFSQNCKSLKQILHESRRILTQRSGGVKPLVLIFRPLRSVRKRNKRAARAGNF